MALSDADKKEMTEIFAGGLVEGLKRFRSDTEEEEAKRQQENPPKSEGAKDDNSSGDKGNGFSLAGFLLGQ